MMVVMVLVIVLCSVWVCRFWLYMVLVMCVEFCGNISVVGLICLVSCLLRDCVLLCR